MGALRFIVPDIAAFAYGTLVLDSSGCQCRKNEPLFRCGTWHQILCVRRSDSFVIASSSEKSAAFLGSAGILRRLSGQ